MRVGKEMKASERYSFYIEDPMSIVYWNKDASFRCLQENTERLNELLSYNIFTDPYLPGFLNMLIAKRKRLIAENIKDLKRYGENKGDKKT